MLFSALVVPLMGTASAATVDNSCLLNVAADTATNPTGATHTLVATLAVTNTAPCDDTVYEVDFEVESGPAVTRIATSTSASTGASDDGNTPLSPDATCTIQGTDNGATPEVNEQFACTIQFTSVVQGTDVIRSWVDDDRNNTTVDADLTEGRYAGATDDGTVTTPAPGDRTEVDDTDVVSKTWTQGLATACVDAEPEFAEAASGTDHTITARATNGTAFTGGDVDGTFNCNGTPLANASVTVTIEDQPPDAFIKSVNGVATGGPQAGGPDTFTATTDASGQVVVVIACVSGTAANCSGDNSVEFVVVGAAAGPNDCSFSAANACDDSWVDWIPAGTFNDIDATPQSDTNEVGQSHTITCSTTDNFGDPLAGQNCDFDITGGPNDTVNVDGNPLTPVGYIGQCTTAANGTCSVSYTSAATGTDTINVFADQNNNDTDDGEDSDVVSKTWVAAGAGTNDVDIDMTNDGSDEATCDGLANGTDDAGDNATASNPVGTPHEVCAERYGTANTPQAGPITFAIVSGPGEFFDDLNNDGDWDVATEPSLGSTTEAQDGSCGGVGGAFNCASLYSETTGNTVVSATANGATAQATKTWTTAATNARNIELTVPATAQPGDVAQAEALVTDVFGNPVPGVEVTFTESGPAVITSTNPAITGANGVAEVLYTSGTEGTSTVSASIAAGTTDCDLLANNPVGATAGNCTDSGVTEWAEFIPTETNHPRTAHLNRFKHINLGGGERSLKVSGTLSTDTGFDACSANQSIKVQIRAGGEWLTRKSDTTNSNGKFSVLIRDITKKYRAVASKSFIVDGDGNIDNCLRAVSNVRRHRH